MNQVRLPVTKPKLVVYGHHAFPLSIISSTSNYLPWFYSNYIQLFTIPSTKKVDFYCDLHVTDAISFASNSMIVSNKISRRNIGGRKTTIDFIENCINQGWYVYIFVDDYFLPCTNAYKNKHVLQDILITGYNSQEQKLYISGFNKNKIFAMETIISYSDFVSAFTGFENIYRNVHEVDERRSSIYMFKAREHISYKFDPTLVSELLEDYVFSQNTSKRLRMFRNPVSPELNIFGMRVYSFLSKLLKNECKNDTITNFKLDPFYIMWEHKICMLDRIEYMLRKRLITEEALLVQFKKVEMKAHSVRTLLMKYLFTNNKYFIVKSLDLLVEIEKNEKTVLNRLLLNLDKNVKKNRGVRM